MSNRIFLLLLVCIAVMVGACSGSDKNGSASDAGDAAADTDTDADTDSDTDADTDTDSDGDTDTWTELDTDTFAGLPCPDLDAGYDDAGPGYQMFLEVNSSVVIGQKVALGTGGFQITGREDFETKAPSSLGLDECALADAGQPVPECSATEGCAPEQSCVRDVDQSGKPIAGTEHCETVRSLMDVGPFAMFGFTDGPMTFAYNASMSGSYVAGSNGQIPATSLAYDTTYTFYGEGDLATGVGAFHGSLYLGPDIELVSPKVPPQAALPYINVNPGKDLAIVWNGAAEGGELTITLMGGKASGKKASVVCRVADDGAFTMPSKMVKAAALGLISLLNTFTIERRGQGEVCGEGLTTGFVRAAQTYMVNVQMVNGPVADAGVDGGA
ncbi:MAG: hypothetical protein PHU25_06475 [Deltaproteobacteria bacterium]|nr:hypothetical protein [Deltaproteobacteria bacterium]